MSDEEIPTPRRLPDTTDGPLSEEQSILLGAARNAASRRQWDQAIQRYEEYFRRFGSNQVDVRREYAGILVTAGRTRQALEVYRQLLDSRQGDERLLLVAADVAILAKDYKLAISLLLPVVQRQPNNYEAANRLARAFLFAGGFPRALQIFEQHLATLRPGEGKAPRTFPAFLVDIDRPADAIAFLQPMLQKEAGDAELLATAIRAYSRLDDKSRALETLQMLAKGGAAAQGIRQDLGDVLLTSGDHELAGLVYQQLLQFDPAHANAQIGLARVAMQQYQPEQACSILQSVAVSDEVKRNFLLAKAEYHQLIGEYVEARQHYATLLTKDPLDIEARLALAKLLQYIQEYEKAKAEYAKTPQDGWSGRRARQGIADTLYDQRRFTESAECCQRLLSEYPADGQAMARLMRDHIKMGDCSQAASIGRGFLTKFATLEPVVLPVQFALGRALLECGRYSDAAREYECLLAKSSGRIPEAWYGLARALDKLNEPVKADRALVAALSEPGHETRNQLQLADLFYVDYDDPHAERLAESILKHDSRNLAALMRLADAQLRAALPSGHIDEVVQTAKAILAQSPTNVRGHVALARAYALAEEYASAVGQYDQLLNVDSSYLVAKLEKARVLLSAHRYGAAAAAYQSALHPDPAEMLRNGLLFFLQSHPESRVAVEPCLETGPITPQLDEELKKLVSSLGDAAAQTAVRGLLLDAEARAAEIAVIRLEADGNSLRDWRDFTAKPLYQKLVAMEPDNVSGFFDLGQVDGELQQTHNAMTAFSQALQIDPLNREAAIALERAGFELNPNVTLFEHAFTQFGRQGLTNDSRFRTGALFNYPIGDENEVVGLGYTNLFYVLPGFPSLSGNALVLNASKRVDDHLLLYGLGNIEEYASRISTRLTYDIGARWVVIDGTTLTANTFLNNVVENGESVQQNIYRYGFGLCAESQLNRFWSAGGFYRFTYYSDVNRFNELFAHTDVLATLPPNQLKFVTLLDYWTYAYQTVFGPDGSIVGAIHPYFAPADFTYCEGRVEFTHWFSRDYFVYSNQCYLSLQYGLAFDNHANIYNNLHAILNWDVKPCLSVGIRADAQLAQVYNMQQLFAYLVWRLPCRP